MNLVKVVSYLEAHSGLDLFTKHLRDGLVKVGHDLDGELRLDTTTTNKIVQGVCKCAADAIHILLSTMLDGDESTFTYDAFLYISWYMLCSAMLKVDRCVMRKPLGR